ncbi:MFS transporter [Candidatus Berkiella aquae]|uniref:Inner membrane transport protein YdhC n=1 Tax=Candidatus Berkiella aquae TaxID=295108 RepID=A0A0Q9YIR6_9GAMM|nr:MFS transporter [Candidatus Berkiella aquae]MCS5710189.1 MFS transporter [Candidatus Berkiella aquae]
MPTIKQFPWLTMTLLISFASVNAVLYTPALPDIATFLKITETTAQGTITWFLIGYALGQLLYGPIAARFGGKKALFIGIALQIMASIGCAFAAMQSSFAWLVICRFLVALGSGVGLKMTFTLVNEWYEPKIASQKIAYLMLAFAITPGLAVGLGGLLTTYIGWTSCFVAGALYGGLLLILVARLKMAPPALNPQALQLSHLRHAYQQQLANTQLMVGGLLMGCATCFVYVFAALAPFIGIELMHMNSATYGMANIIPSIGLISGSLCAGALAKRHPLKQLIIAGVMICGLGVIIMLIALMSNQSPILSLFIPMMVIYFGLSLIMANASTLAMSHVTDKAHGSAVMNFINMGLATLVVLGLGLYTIHAMLLPIVYVLVCLFMGMMTLKLANNN